MKRGGAEKGGGGGGGGEREFMPFNDTWSQ